MRILHILYFYRPHVSGLTIYAERLCRELAHRGHDVTVLTSRHKRSLPRTEHDPDGVSIVRLPVAASFNRAVLMPTLLLAAFRHIREHDVVHLHLPMAETAPLASLSRMLGKRVVATQHADLELTGSLLEGLAAGVAQGSARLGARLAHHTVANTQSRIAHSPVMRAAGDRANVIPPPCEVQKPTLDARDTFRKRHDLGCGPVIGFAGRFVAEKGVEYLLQTIPALREQWPNVTIALAGPHRDSRTGEWLHGPWDDWLTRYAANVRVLGNLFGQELADFYAACDVLVLPSTNLTETFGMVQVEAMLSGTPVVASDLPGVNEPVLTTGMGRLAPPRDVDALANAIIEVVTHRERYVRPTETVEELYSLGATVDAWESLYHAG